MVFSGRIKNFKNSIMKTSYIFLFCLIVFGCTTSCSSNDNVVVPPIDVTPNAIFQFIVNGKLFEGGFTAAYKKSHTIHLGTDRSDTTFLISFDENGHFGKIIYTYQEPISGTKKKFITYRDFSSNNFNFQLISYDALNKRVNANFYGYIYRSNKFEFRVQVY